MGFLKLGQVISGREIQDLVRDDLRLVERELSFESAASVEAVTDIAKYLNGNGGKRLRPILLLLSCRLLAEPSPTAIRLAAVVEMIHAATLVHDDVIDTADTRRGKPSVNALWGNPTAVLSGDWLYMQAFQMALRERNFHILDVLIGLTQRMVEGELLQLERIGQLDLTEADYMELVDRKTAALFSACAKLGSIAGGADELAETRLAEFGWNLGMAFQLTDDMLDFTARESVLGKPVGNDLREGKVTLPIIYALQQASREDRKTLQQVLEDGHYQRVSLGEVVAVIQRNCGIDRARERAHSFTLKALALLGEFPDSPGRRALAGVTALVTDRDH